MMSKNKPVDSRAAATASALTGCAAFLVYLYTLAPTVSGEDGGELVAAAYTLGIPHPTGYPIWTILAYLFTKLIPFGDIAWRVNLMSAFWAAATVAILAQTLQRQSINRAVACVAALSFAFSREFWEQSVIAEVYTLNAFFTIACMYFLLEWTNTRATRPLYAFTLLYSLSLANHSTMFLLGPLFLAWIFITHPPIMKNYRTLIACITLFTLGLLVHLYLPIRSLANPAMDWGNPETFQAFWDVFTRKQYQSIMTNEHSISLLLQQLREFMRYTLWEFTPWVLLLTIPGSIVLYKQNKPAFVLTTGIFTIVFLASIIIPNFPIEHHSIWMNTTYWIPCYLMLAITIAFGLNELFDSLPNHSWLQADALLIVFISPLFVHLDHNDQSDYYYARDYAQNQLNTMSRNAIYFGSGDYTIFPLTYLLIVDAQRPDITLANQYGYIAPELYADMPADLRTTFPESPGDADKLRLFDWILANTNRPVYTTTPWPSSTRKPVQRGLLFEYLTTPSSTQQNDIWLTYIWHTNTLNLDEIHGDWTAELINYEYRVKLAQESLRDLDFEEAVQKMQSHDNISQANVLLNEAAQLVHHDKHALHNIALVYARSNQIGPAARAFKEALHDDPAYPPVLYNLANALLKQQQYNEARPYAETLLKQSPNNTRFIKLHKKILQGLSTSQD